jgi:hypothetical protein
MGAAIGTIRKRVGSERAISVVHTDLPDNDFRPFSRRWWPTRDSYLRNDPAAFASAIARTEPYGPDSGI